MLNRIKCIAYAFPLLALATVGCKKGTFDINNNNPNQPSSASPDYVLSAAMTTSALVAQGGDEDFMNWYMGYWAVSGDYIPDAQLLQYNINTDFGADNWNATYIALENYKYVISNAPSPNYAAIGLIMQAYSFDRLVDMYNNVPYTQALQGGIINYPTFDNAANIVPSLISKLDSAIGLINAGAKTPGNADVMFQGNMDKWKRFANTMKLKILMNLAATSGGPAFIQAHLSGLTASDFLGAGEDASVNPGYSNAADNQQSPLWQDLGFSISGTPVVNHVYGRASSYAVDFYLGTNDPRVGQFYAKNTSGSYRGRAFGSVAQEHNSDISGFGPGILNSPSEGAVILPACESFFLQAEAYQRGYMTGDAAAAYQSGVTESFRQVGVANYSAAATAYTAQSDPRVNWNSVSDKITLILTQAWAAYNTFDPLEAWNNWRRTGIPADLPVSIYPGTTATHIIYRLQYPTSEYKYNSQNVSAEGNIDPLNTKVFFMP